tara:strand:- start:246 stop:848 length:603 start_codon:yes stop_codon:yes gene_type:complete
MFNNVQNDENLQSKKIRILFNKIVKLTNNNKVFNKNLNIFLKKWNIINIDNQIPTIYDKTLKYKKIWTDLNIDFIPKLLDFINKKKTYILRKLKTYEKDIIYICKQKKSKKNKISKNFKELQKIILTSRDCYFKKINKEIILETNDNKHLNILIPVIGDIYIDNNKIKDYIIVDTSIPIKVKIDKNNGYILIIDILHPNI